MQKALNRFFSGRSTPLNVGWGSTYVITGLVVQWVLVYFYFLWMPTVFAPETEHHAILNTAVVLGYHMMAYAALAIFLGRVSSRLMLALPGLSLLVYESNLLSYVVYGIEYLFYGEVSFKYAKERLVNKQNIITGFLAMLIMVGGIMALTHRVNVTRKLGLACSSALMMALIVYHVNLYFFQFNPLVDKLEEWQSTELRQLSFSHTLNSDCKRLEGVECYRFKDGESWPEKARIQGSRKVTDLEEDYVNDWKELIAEKNRHSPDEPMIWTEVVRESSFDGTFAPPYSALIVFTKYYDQNTVIIHRDLITHIFQMSERLSLCILLLIAFWLALTHLVTSSHPRGEDPVPIRRYLWIWLITGTVAFFFEFQIYLHAMLIGLAGVLLYKRLWKLLLIELGVYAVTFSHVALSLVLIKGLLADTLVFGISSASAILMMIGIKSTLRFARPDWRIFGTMIAMVGLSMILQGYNTDLAEDMTSPLPVLLFLLSLTALLIARHNPLYLFCGMYCLMAGIMTSAMVYWFVPGMLEDSIGDVKAQGFGSHVNMPLATSYFVYGYFSIIMGLVFNHLNKAHLPLFERMREKMTQNDDGEVVKNV